MKKVIIKVLYLKDIKTLDFDRKLNPQQVEKILRAIQSLGILRLMVVLETKAISGTTEYYTLDGKHLKYAMMKSGIEKIECIIFKTNDLHRIVQAMAGMNNTQLAWTTENFVIAFKAMLLPDYNELYLYQLANGFTYPISARVLGNSSLVKKGKFKVVNKDAGELTDCIIDVTNLLGTNSAKFMMAYIMFFRSAMKTEYNHKSMMRKLAIVKKNFHILDDVQLMKDNLEELYAK